MTYLNLFPEQIGALWSLLDAEYLHGPVHDLMLHLGRHPDFCYYDGDRLEEVTDIIADKIKHQLANPLDSGNVELHSFQVSALEDALKELHG
jgi:hypothetical protein